MKYLFTLCLLVFSLSASAQWQQTGAKVRYVNGLGIPTKDTAAGVAADSSQILIRPQDSALYVKYKRTWLRVGGGGGSIAGSGTTNYIPKFTSSTAIGNSQIFDNGTNVGIGTTSPSEKLHLVGNTFRQNDASNSFGYTISTTSATTTLATLFGGSSFGIRTGGSGSDNMRITSAGDVGIGTASPNSRLHTTGSLSVNDIIYLQRASSSTFIPIANFWNGTGSPMAGTKGDILAIGQSGGDAVVIATNNTERMRITSAGDVGIGTTSPNSRLDVDKGSQSAGGTTPSGALLISNRTAGNGILELGVSASAIGWLQSRNSTSATYYPLSLNPSAGNVLIGTATDNGTDRLQVSGSASVTSLFGVGTSPSAGTVHIKTTSPSIAIDDNDNAGTAAIRFRPQSASFATRGSIELVSTGSAAPTRFVIASTDTMTFRTNNVERMRVTSAGGNVLISKTTDNGIDKLQVNGSIDAKGFAQAYTTKTGAYTATTSDYLIDCLSGTFTVTLPDALLNVGRILVIKNSGTGTITVDGNGSQTIDGATTYSLSAQWATVQIMCDGGNWKIISKF